MGLVHFLDPVDYISGKISKKFRTIYNYRKLSDRRYTQVRGVRTTPVTADEILTRNRFTAISKAIKTRRHDLTKIAADQAAYMAQRNDPNGKRSMQAWYWMVEGEAYDQAHS